MEGYEIYTGEDESIGHAVEQDGDFLVLEHGLRHTKHALPLEFVHVDHETKAVRTTLSKELIEHSPKLEHNRLDVQAIADYYGLSDTSVPDDQLGLGVEEETDDHRDKPAPVGRPIIPPDSHT